MVRKYIFVFLAVAVFMLAGSANGEAAGDQETGLEYFKVRHGNRESSRIAITMDDANEREWVWKAVELCRQYGITMTFFPNGFNLKDEDREGWLDAIDAGCEIASHGNDHKNMKEQSTWAVLYKLGLFQQKLDRMLQVHYPVRWFRPPFGAIADASGNESSHTRTIKLYGYEHALLWDVSETTAGKAMEKVQNGSILLYHARKKDYECLAELIPMLLEAGYEPVTVSALFGYEPPEIGGELYTFDKNLYLEK